MQGAGHYEVFICDRGGDRRLFALSNVTSLRWGRQRDDISQATVTINNLTVATCQALADVHAARNELSVVRDGEVVWEGPITLIETTSEQVTFTASDVAWYLSRRSLNKKYDFRRKRSTAPKTNKIKAMETILRDHYGPADGSGDPHNFNVAKYLTPIFSADDAKTVAKFPARSRTVWEVLDQWAERGGIDYTVVGRRIIWWDVHTKAATMRELSDEDFNDTLTIVEYGSEVATRAYVTSNSGWFASAEAPQQWRDYYGPLDKIVNDQDEADGKRPTEAEKEDMRETAERRVASGYPAPVSVRVPEGAALNPNGLLTFGDLVPGTWALVRSAQTCRQVVQWHKLNTVTVTVSQGVETVSVGLGTAPAEWEEPT